MLDFYFYIYLKLIIVLAYFSVSLTRLGDPVGHSVTCFIWVFLYVSKRLDHKLYLSYSNHILLYTQEEQPLICSRDLQLKSKLF